MMSRNTLELPLSLGRLTKQLLEQELPREIAVIKRRRRNRKKTLVWDREDAVVIFAAIVGYTNFCRGCESVTLVQALDEFFSQLDLVCEEYKVLKIKTIVRPYEAVVARPAHFCREGDFPSLSSLMSYWWSCCRIHIECLRVSGIG